MPAIRSQLVKWGNSQAVRIPKTVIKQARLQEGDELEIQVLEGRITIESLRPKLSAWSPWSQALLAVIVHYQSRRSCRSKPASGRSERLELSADALRR